MDRIISDCYWKESKPLLGPEPNTEFNQKISAVNAMYGWLYDEGILEKVSFEFKDYSNVSYFALDANDLVPFRTQMESSGLTDAQMAVYAIFDEPCTPCLYSGTIEPGWTMATYRDVDGSVGRSWETNLIQHLNTKGIYEVHDVLAAKGPKSAASAMFGLHSWYPSDIKKRGSLNEKIKAASEDTYIKENSEGRIKLERER